jgi:Divergent InlB B-repeat domain
MPHLLHVPAMASTAPQTCVCESLSPAPYAAYRLAGADALVPAASYDEQLGATFTQSFTVMAYNVTAVEQSDPTTGAGPAYLLNGLSNSGYWYQVGISWNWNVGSSPGTGFAMSYEVFDPQGDSVFPTNGQGGLLALSGIVNGGDTILLNLYYLSGQVVMYVHDWNTGASAVERYDAEGATEFVGETGSVANNDGYFTGLMTEWYHPQPYDLNEVKTLYENPDFALTSAWLWIDEYNPASNGQKVFANQTSGPVSFGSDPRKLHEFASNGATEYMDAYEFVTGLLSSNDTTVQLTLNYTVAGGGSGYSPPVLQYYSGGVHLSANLSEAPTSYNVDEGSTWSINAVLAGSTDAHRWGTGQQVSEIATGRETIQLRYYQQFLGNVSYSVSGPDRPPAPFFDYVGFGSDDAVVLNSTSTSFWADVGTPYSMSAVINGSGGGQRWIATGQANGTASSPFSLSLTYYDQYLVKASYSVSGGGSIGSGTPQLTSASPVTLGPNLDGTAQGKSVVVSLMTTPSTTWLDSGSKYSVSQSFENILTLQNASGTTIVPPSPNERWMTNGSSGTITSGLVINTTYDHQYLVGLRSGSAEGGNVSSTGGWVDAGSSIRVNATAESGWQFEFWEVTASTSPSQAGTATTQASADIMVEGPLNETAAFYPGLSIRAATSTPVTYNYANAFNGTTVHGTVPGGTTTVVYGPVGAVQLTAATPGFPDAFDGWSGASTSQSSAITISVTGPESIDSVVSLDYLELGAIFAIAIILVVIVAVAAVTRASRKTVGRPAA